MTNRAKDEALAVKIFGDKYAMAKVSAEHAAATIRRAIHARQHARIIAATGAAQFEFLEALTGDRGYRLAVRRDVSSG